jgi:carboxymethylenebutenolidase
MKNQLPRALFLSALLSLPLAASTQAQDWARARLEASPRHREYVALKHDNRTVQAFVVYPEVKSKAPVVILIHEIFGLSDWAKAMADELAGEGFIVVAPDLLSGQGPKGGGSDEFSSQDDRVKAVSALDPAEVLADLDAAADYGKKLPAANGQIAVAGFCWGGSKSFAFAAHRKDLSAAFVFYGTGPSDVSTITAPVYGFYAGDDARVGATVPATKDAMKAAGKFYDPVTYEGAGHGFMRAGEDPGNKNPANKTARDQAFARLVKLLKEMKPAHAANHAAKTGVVARKSENREASCHDAAAVPAT